MQQTIKPLGIATNPSDYDCADGELAASFNIINEDWALRPLPQPVATNITLQDGDEIRCIHATSTFKHYIATNGSTLAWYDPNEEITEQYPRRLWHPIPLPATIHKVTPIGNTLAVLTDSGLYYLLWKYDNTNNATYTNLGSKPPFLELQFGTSSRSRLGTPRTGNIFASMQTGLNWTEPPDDALDNISFVVEQSQTITETVWALINKTNAEITKANHFYAPFIVRYCYRMKDSNGSMIMHSAPVFVPIASPFQYLTKLGWNSSEGAGEGDVYVQYYYNNVALQYCVINSAVLDELRNNWSDIVDSVDIFVSLPLVRENDTERITSAKYHFDNPVFYSGNSAYEMTYHKTHDNMSMMTARIRKLDIPFLYTEDEYWDKIKATSDFYQIASYKIDETRLQADDSFHDVDIRTGVLSNLAVQTAMKDDYHTHNDVLPTIGEDNRCITSLFNYNNRLSIAAPTERLFKGFSLDTMLPAETATDKQNYIRAIVVHLRTEQGIKRVVYSYGNTTTGVSKLLLSSLPLFYPDNRAFRMDIYYLSNNRLSVIPLPMKQHPLLNGATTNGGLITSLSDTLPTGQVVSDNIIPFANDRLTTLNQIRTSEVDNPFYYPAINYKRVGVGTILALSTSAKALSQGQFGQHPLYAFCTDGVWALGVDTTDGTFVPAQPFTRDVCSNPDSILQLDSTVLFPTDRGIMLVSGSQTQCITEKLDYPHFQLGILPQNILFMPSDPRGIPTTIRQYIKGCKMIYDYCNQHVIVFNTAHTYAYVYSLKSGLWAMMQADFVATLNAYPHAMAVNVNGQLVEFPDTSNSQFSILNSQFYVTRPFKLGSNEHKTITALVQHGMIEDRQHVKLILYGSRDLATWHVVGSSTTNTLRGLSGTPYTAFRLAVIADLTATESISDFVVEFTPKHTRVLR